VHGRLSDAGQGVSGARLELQADSYPFRRFASIATATSAADGTYAFTGVRPNRNTRLRVIAVGATPAQSASLGLVVTPASRVSAQALKPGAVRLTLAVGHTAYGHAGAERAYWWLAPREGGELRLEAVTQTTESAHLTTATATVDPPAAHFSYRVCFSPAWRHAMGASASYSSCVTDSGLALRGEGSGTPSAAFPGSPAVAAAGRYLDGRAGATAYAVVDDTGRLGGVRVHEHFETASVVKVMMLVSYLQMLAAEHRGVDAAASAILYPMIHISDNNAASAVFAAIGGYPALERIAAQAQMTDFVPGVGWWAYTQTSAADQARFFFELDGLIPAQFQGYARGLLSGIEPSQSWGVPPVARPRWQVFFKTGALPSQGLFNEAALLERPGVHFALCVLSNGDPSMGYGEDTIAGVGSALLSG
jgi:Beta-lactamase enzyme family